MRIFLDTEFTDLSAHGELISLGAITESGEHFYKECSPVPANCSPFVREHVLPHLDINATPCAPAELGDAFIAWLKAFPAPTVVVDSDWDIYVISKAFASHATRQTGALHLTGTTASVVVQAELVPGYTGGMLVAFMDATWAMQKHPGFRHHHALDDAKALREGVLAAEKAA